MKTEEDKIGSPRVNICEEDLSEETLRGGVGFDSDAGAEATEA